MVPRLVAFYLPQYHPIPENDAWWGPGFTEWTHVANARPLFRGHRQPRLPGELGFYDLRLPETRAAQAELAAAHGIAAFCYWHYWIGGRRLLERPFEEVLKSGEPKFPFCLGWANHDWYGNPYRLLLRQTYPGVADHTAHFYWLLRAFGDDRYFKVDGKPVFYVYKPALLPEARRVTDLWRELAHRAGLKGLHLVAEVRPPLWDVGGHGFDARVTVNLPGRLDHLSLRPWRSLRFLLRRLARRPAVYRYSRVVPALSAAPAGGGLSYPCLIPNWDNTPRWGPEGLVLHRDSPEAFRAHVRRIFRRVATTPPGERVVFIKSWNEWAEGNYLEPDREFGRGYLRVLAEELRSREWSSPAMAAADGVLQHRPSGGMTEPSEAAVAPTLREGGGRTSQCSPCSRRRPS